MAVNKVDINGETVIDLTSDTVTADTLAEGSTAHGADGEPIIGRMTAGDGNGEPLYVTYDAEFDNETGQYVVSNLSHTFEEIQDAINSGRRTFAIAPNSSSTKTPLARHRNNVDIVYSYSYHDKTSSQMDKAGYSACHRLTLGETLIVRPNDCIYVTASIDSYPTNRAVLIKTNTTAYTPTADYHPATKKYVDDSIPEQITDNHIVEVARTLPEDEDELNIVAGKDWGDGAWLALRKIWREDRGGSFELFSFGENGADWKSLYGHVNDGLKWGDDYVAMTSDIPSDEHVNSLIDAKLTPLEALANEALEVIG